MRSPSALLVSVARALGVVVLLLVVLTPMWAGASSWFVEEYDVLVAPRTDGTAHFTVRIVYDPFVESRLRGGAVYLGLRKPTSVVAHDIDGEALEVSLAAHPSFPEAGGDDLLIAMSSDPDRPGWHATFSLPPPHRQQERTLQEAVIEFDQELDTSFAWGGRAFLIEWAPAIWHPNQWRYRVVSEASSSGYECARDDATRICVRESRVPHPFSFPLMPRTFATWATDLVPVGLAFLASVVLLTFMLRRLRAEAIRERGVVSDEALAAPRRQDGYRAPPLAAAVGLSRRDAVKLRGSIFVVGIGMLATFAPTLLLRHRPVPIGFISAPVVLVGALFMCAYLRAKRARIVLAVTPVLASTLFVASGPVAGGVGAGVMLAIFAIASSVLTHRSSD